MADFAGYAGGQGSGEGGTFELGVTNLGGGGGTVAMAAEVLETTPRAEPPMIP